MERKELIEQFMQWKEKSVRDTCTWRRDQLSKTESVERDYLALKRGYDKRISTGPWFRQQFEEVIDRGKQLKDLAQALQNYAHTNGDPALKCRRMIEKEMERRGDLWNDLVVSNFWFDQRFRSEENIKFTGEQLRRRFRVFLLLQDMIDEAQRMAAEAPSFVATPEDIVDRLKQRVYSAEDERKDGGDVCPVCLETRLCGQTIVMLPCGHRYHYSCAVGLAATKRKDCGLCRRLLWR